MTLSDFPAALADALTVVDEQSFVMRENGTMVSQSSAQSIIADLISRLDVSPGMSILEIGTGSGYSTALLAHLTGPEGRVTSLDVVDELVERAQRMLPASGFSNVTVRCTDGSMGAADQAPFDRIVSWATAPYLPADWTAQLAPDGLIVAPIALAPVSKSGLGVRIRLAPDGEPIADRLFPAGFVEMHDEEIEQWLLPPYGVAASIHDDSGFPSWLSGEYSEINRESAERLLRDLTRSGTKTQGPLRDGENAADFRAWLLATRPEGLTTGALGSPAWLIGVATHDGAALTEARTANQTISVGASHSAERLLDLAGEWREAGLPGLGQITAALVPTSGGWSLRGTSR